MNLLEGEQCEMINCLQSGEAIVLNGENSEKNIQLSIATESYTHVFTSPEMALSKKKGGNRGLNLYKILTSASWKSRSKVVR